MIAQRHSSSAHQASSIASVLHWGCTSNLCFDCGLTWLVAWVKLYSTELECRQPVVGNLPADQYLWRHIVFTPRRQGADAAA